MGSVRAPGHGDTVRVSLPPSQWRGRWSRTGSQGGHGADLGSPGAGLGSLGSTGPPQSPRGVTALGTARSGGRRHKGASASPGTASPAGDRGHLVSDGS